MLDLLTSASVETLITFIAGLTGVGGATLIAIRRGFRAFRIIRQAHRAFDEEVREDTQELYKSLKASGKYPDLVWAMERGIEKIKALNEKK